MFVFVPPHMSLSTTYGGYGVTLSGYFTVGDSTNYVSNTKCADVSGMGYYSCSSSLRGRYLAFISTAIAGSDYEGVGLAIQNLMAFSSTNLIASSTMVQEPTRRIEVHMPSYAVEMATLNPRSQLAAINITPYNCAQYDLSTTASENLMIFKLASATYVQYVHATGDGHDGVATNDPTVNWEV